MSPRVKIPAEGHSHQESQPSSSSSLQRRTASSKRPLVYSDEDDEDVHDRARIPISQKTKRARTDDDDDDDDETPSRDVSPVDPDMDVDIDTYHEPSASAADDSRFLSDVPTRDDSPPLRSLPHKGKTVTTNKRRKSTSVSTSVKKKSHVVYSDEEQSEVNIDVDSAEEDLDASALHAPEISDDDFEVDTDTPPRRGASKAKASGGSKGKAGMLKGAKGKGSKEKDGDKEIFMKDERRLPPSLAATSRASSAADQSQPSELFCNDDVAPSATNPSLADPSQSAKDTTGQPPLKKRKLPTIKKNKTAGATGISTPSAMTHKPPLPPTQEPPKLSVPVSEQRKQALTGVRDVDLGDRKVYTELFKGTGGITPRSGLKKDEERRKDLNRMRDEARARRAEEAKFIFDLQSQANKIARFEQRLRAENSTVLHPNFLAAKFRDEWELEKRQRRRDERGKEEGEARA